MLQRKKISKKLWIILVGDCLILLLLLKRGISEDVLLEDRLKHFEFAGDDSVYSCTRADIDMDSTNAMEIDLSQQEVIYTITDAGDYLLFGDYNGQICIDAEEQIVHLILGGVNIYSLSGSAINVRSAGKVIITLMEGTSNCMRDSAHYRGAADGAAAIYSDCDLTINGYGSLEVYGFYDDAIYSRDMIKILGGEITILAAGNGIQGEDGLLIDTISISVESKGNGLCSTRTESMSKGTIEIIGGKISVIAGKYTISSSKDLYVRNCAIWSNSVLGDLDILGRGYIMEGCMENE